MYTNIVRFDFLNYDLFNFMKNIIKVRGSVYFNEGSWNALAETLGKLKPTKVFILTDTNTNTHCLELFLKNVTFKITPEVLTIPSGESHKTITTCVRLWNELSEKGADRNSLLINLGGGVVTDLGGFVASTFKRGIEFINIPTTLLAMVDASVGGKNGVDLGILKNQVGIIRNAKCVIINSKFLKTLPDEQMISGYAEILKHGLIHSEAYWNLAAQFDSTNSAETDELIWGSVLIKNEVITEDPNENGIRKTLNYGHTLGHAIESYLLEHHTKEALLHGEAIAIGMILATYISSEELAFPKSKLETITQTILQNFPKVTFNELDIEEVIKLLIYDKKNNNGKIYFVLLSDFGKHKLNREVSNNLILRAFKYYKNFIILQ
jgi:3-dehydroquinate synthase